MAGYETITTDGRWLWYPLEPADVAVDIRNRPDVLAVHIRNQADAAMTMVWKGETDLSRLTNFFEKSAEHVCGPTRYSRLRFVMQEGEPKLFDRLAWKIGDLPEQFKTAEFMRFECVWGTPPNRENPVLVVFANLDSRGDTLAALQQSVGIHVRPRDYLSKLVDEEITEVVTSSRFFRPERYKRETILGRLRDVRSDVTRYTGLAL
jgi:hypothetical protein